MRIKMVQERVELAKPDPNIYIKVLLFLAWCQAQYSSPSNISIGLSLHIHFNFVGKHDI
jgi:hypothetical protein